MIYTPNETKSIIYLNAIQEAPERANEKNISAEEVGVIEVGKYLLEIEKKLRLTNSIHEELANIGLELSQAVLEDRDEDANRYESAYYSLAEKHPHVSIMKEVPQLIRELSVPGNIKHSNK